MTDISALEADVSGAGLQKSERKTGERGIAATALADQPQGFARTKRQCHVVNRAKAGATARQRRLTDREVSAYGVHVEECRTHDASASICRTSAFRQQRTIPPPEAASRGGAFSAQALALSPQRGWNRPPLANR